MNMRIRGVNWASLAAPKRRQDGRRQVAPVPVGAMSTWGFNALRLQVNSELWLADCPCVYGWTHSEVLGYRQIVDRVVDDCFARGMAVLLSLTVCDEGRHSGCDASSQPFLTKMADRRAVDFWSQAGMLYAGRGAMFLPDLFNEPHHVTAGVWSKGGTVTAGSLSYPAVGMQTLLDGLRVVSPQFAVVSGTGYASNPLVHVTRPLSDPLDRVIVGVHAYAPDEDHRYQVPAALHRAADLHDRGYEVIVTEFGNRFDQNPTFNARCLAFLESHELPWCAYTFIDSPRPVDCSLCKDQDDYWHPSPNGQPVWDVLHERMDT